MAASCLFALAVLLSSVLPGVPAWAGNGDPYSRLRPLFQFDQPRPAPRRAVKPPRKGSAAPRRAAEPRRKAKPPSRPVPAVAAVPAKAADAKTVLVVGDFFAQALAEGLEESFSDEPSVRIESAAQARLGLTREGAALPEGKGNGPAAVVVMLGGNDRRPLTAEGRRLPLRSPGWNAAYGERTAAVIRQAEDRRVPLFWVGLPAVASAKASEDFLAFNELARSAVEAGSGTFVDSWDGFVSESGTFVTFGPGVNGQNVRLRTKDGIGFTRAGRRKLAFFAARPLAKVLGLPLPAGLPPEAQPGTALGPGRTAPMPLSGYAPAAGEAGELLGGVGAPPDPVGTSLHDLPPVAGRADDFSVAPAAR